jgi:uncharacterized membrane protein YeiH
MLRLLLAFTALLYTAQAQEQLKELSKLTGIVEDAAGWKVLNAQVAVRLAGRKKVIATAITDHKGGFTLSDVGAGTYDICFASTGYVGICETAVLLKPGLNNLGPIRLRRDIQGGISFESPAP